MNILIKKLANQAGAFTESGLDECSNPILVGDNIEKFAKIVVEHCCFLCTYPDHDDEQSYYADLFASLLRDTFGIK